MVISYENVGFRGKKKLKMIQKSCYECRDYVENVCADYINLCNLQLLQREEDENVRREEIGTV